MTGEFFYHHAKLSKLWKQSLDSKLSKDGLSLTSILRGWGEEKKEKFSELPKPEEEKYNIHFEGVGGKRRKKKKFSELPKPEKEKYSTILNPVILFFFFTVVLMTRGFLSNFYF